MISGVVKLQLESPEVQKRENLLIEHPSVFVPTQLKEKENNASENFTTVEKLVWLFFFIFFFQRSFWYICNNF